MTNLFEKYTSLSDLSPADKRNHIATIFCLIFVGIEAAYDGNFFVAALGGAGAVLWHFSYFSTKPIDGWRKFFAFVLLVFFAYYHFTRK